MKYFNSLRFLQYRSNTIILDVFKEDSSIRVLLYDPTRRNTYTYELSELDTYLTKEELEESSKAFKSKIENINNLLSLIEKSDKDRIEIADLVVENLYSIFSKKGVTTTDKLKSIKMLYS